MPKFHKVSQAVKCHSDIFFVHIPTYVHINIHTYIYTDN